MGNKSLYAAALDSELHHNDSLDKFCKLFNNIADAFDWMKKEHTDEEIAEILSKLGYNIEIKPTVPKAIEPEQNPAVKKKFKKQCLLDQKQAAEYLGVTVGTLDTWRSYGKHNIPFLRLGSRIKYRKEDLDKWIKSHIVQPENQDTYLCKAG